MDQGAPALPSLLGLLCVDMGRPLFKGSALVSLSVLQMVNVLFLAVVRIT